MRHPSLQRALAAGDTARAAEIYAGPFLDGFFVSGSPDFEQWADAERERYRRAYGTALEGLAREAAAAGAFARAADWWRRLAAQDPGNSRVTLRLMEALEAAGDRAGAIRQARVHAAVLEREFEAEADPAIVALAERRARRMGVHPPVVAAVRADLNDMNGAVEWLERAYRERHPALALMSADGRLAEDPRYLDLRRRVGRSP